ncbi:hypothetical protein AB0K35_03245 [Micromonospora sp. NPDC053740]|uniref:hypothetical protein n=1 Tax=Micromonospora sp. NPDC053740 TaxID=3155173 RepID=UPI00342BA4BF
MPGFTGVADEPAEWLVIGTLNDEPLLIRRDSGAVWYFPAETTDEWWGFLDEQGLTSPGDDDEEADD